MKDQSLWLVTAAAATLLILCLLFKFCTTANSSVVPTIVEGQSCPVWEENGPSSTNWF